MHFSHNAKTHKIETSEPDVWVEWLSADREGREGFVLSLRGSRIGFRTEAYRPGGRSTADPDFRRVWRIDDPFCRITSIKAPTGKLIEHTDTTRFSSKPEQDEALAVVSAALEHFDILPQALAKPGKVATVELTPDAKARIDSGHYVL